MQAQLHNSYYSKSGTLLATRPVPDSVVQNINPNDLDTRQFRGQGHTQEALVAPLLNFGEEMSPDIATSRPDLAMHQNLKIAKTPNFSGQGQVRRATSNEVPLVAPGLDFSR